MSPENPTGFQKVVDSLPPQVRFALYSGFKVIQDIGIPAPQLPEHWKYTQVDAGVREYNQTFGINSEILLANWHALHPYRVGGIIEFAGYGFAPSQLLKRRFDKKSNERNTAISVSLDPGPFHDNRVTKCIGDMAELAQKLDYEGNLKEKIVDALHNQGCSQGAALIWCRPIIAFSSMEIANGISSETVDSFYLALFKSISQELLAPDGAFAFQFPHTIRNPELFLKGLHALLGDEFEISSLHTSKFMYKLWKLSPTKLVTRLKSVTIKRKGRNVNDGNIIE